MSVTNYFNQKYYLISNYIDPTLIGGTQHRVALYEEFTVLLFGENPQAVAYSAQPLCWSG